MNGGLEVLQPGERKLVAGSRQAIQTLDGLINPAMAARLEESRTWLRQGYSVLPIGRYVVRLEEDRAGTRARSVGAFVQAYRKRLGWSQARLARRCGMARANLARLESGRHEPLLSSVKRVASALGVKLSDLISEPSSRATPEDTRWLESDLKDWARTLRRMDRNP